MVERNERRDEIQSVEEKVKWDEERSMMVEGFPPVSNLCARLTNCSFMFSIQIRE